MDSWDERMSQPPEPKCHGGCLPGSCWCYEQNDEQDGASLLPEEARLEPSGEGHTVGRLVMLS